MRIMIVGRQQDELTKARRFPGREEIVQHSVQCLLPHGSVSRERPFRIDIHSVLDRRGPKHAIFRREIVGEAFSDQRGAADR